MKRSCSIPTSAARGDLKVHFPPLALCGDNGAMVAGLAYHYLARGETDGFDLAPQSRVPIFKRGINPA